MHFYVHFDTRETYQRETDEEQDEALNGQIRLLCTVIVLPEKLACVSFLERENEAEQ